MITFSEIFLEWDRLWYLQTCWWDVNIYFRNRNGLVPLPWAIQIWWKKICLSSLQRSCIPSFLHEEYLCRLQILFGPRKSTLGPLLGQLSILSRTIPACFMGYNVDQALVSLTTPDIEGILAKVLYLRVGPFWQYTIDISILRVTR